MAVSVRDIYLALAKEVPNPDGSETLVANPYATWNDVNPALPTRAIEVYGPPRGSGTRTIFSNLTLLDGCNSFDWMRAMKQEDPFEHRTKCRTLRRGRRLHRSQRERRFYASAASLQPERSRYFQLRGPGPKSR